MKKISILIVCLSICLSIFCISSFALEPFYQGEYYFKDDLSFPSSADFSEAIYFTCDGVEYTKMSLGVEHGSSGLWLLTYSSPAVDSLEVWSSYDGWYDPKYQYIYIQQIPDYSFEVVQFLTDNQGVAPTNGWYYDFKNLIIDAVFDGESPGSAEELAVSLVALVVTLFAICLPLIVILVIFRNLLLSRYL